MDEMFFYESRQPVFDNNDEIRYKVKTKPKQKKINSKRNAVACGVAIVLTIFLVGIGLGYWSCNLQKAIVDTDGSDEEKRTTQIFGRHEDIAAQIDRREIEKHLRFARNIDLIYNRTIDTEHNYVQTRRKEAKEGGGGGPIQSADNIKLRFGNFRIYGCMSKIFRNNYVMLNFPGFSNFENYSY